MSTTFLTCSQDKLQLCIRHHRCIQTLHKFQLHIDVLKGIWTSHYNPLAREMATGDRFLLGMTGWEGLWVGIGGKITVSLAEKKEEPYGGGGGRGGRRGGRGGSYGGGGDRGGGGTISFLIHYNPLYLTVKADLILALMLPFSGLLVLLIADCWELFCLIACLR